MGAGAGGGFVVFGQISQGLFPPLSPIIPDSGPASLVYTILMALTSVGQESSAPPLLPTLRQKTQWGKQIPSWSGDGWALCASALATGEQMMQI